MVDTILNSLIDNENSLDFQKKMLKTGYPNLNSKEIGGILNIREAGKGFLSDSGYENWEQFLSDEKVKDNNNIRYFKVADKKDGEIGVFSDYRGEYSPETADTSYYFMDPEAFKDIKVGDYITFNIHSNIGESLLFNAKKFKI